MKKDFKAAAPTREQLNPALQFITLPESNQEAEAPSGTEEKPETRNKRVQLLFYPSLYEDIKERARMHHNSVNNEIIEILQEALKCQ